MKVDVQDGKAVVDREIEAGEPADAAEAQRRIESGTTVGKLALIP